MSSYARGLETNLNLIKSDDLSTIMDKASNYLENDNFVKAIEWYSLAERIARKTKNEMALCDLLGDKAVAFRGLGNIQRAIDTYVEVIELSRKNKSWLNLSRWSQNLGLIYREYKNDDAARLCLKESMDAAIRCGIPLQISTSLGHYSLLLLDQGRYLEAIESINEAIAACPDNLDLPKTWNLDLYKTWGLNKSEIFTRWGMQLTEEGQIEEAVRAYSDGIYELDLKKPEEAKMAAELHIRMAELFYQRLYNLYNALHELDEAITIFRSLNDEVSVNMIETKRRDLANYHPKITFNSSSEVLSNQMVSSNIDKLYNDIKTAFSRGDHNEELTLRMHLLTLLQRNNDNRTMQEFEDMLAIVRRAKDRRRELLLCLNFTLYLLNQGKKPRALSLAQRGEELASQSHEIMQKIIALLNLGYVWETGFSEPAKAVEYYRESLSLLKDYRKKEPAASEKLVEDLMNLLETAIKTMLSLGFNDNALDMLSLINPQGIDRIGLKKESPIPSSSISSQAPIDMESLKKMRNSDLDRILTIWNRVKELQSQDKKGFEKESNDDKVLHRMQEVAEILDWKSAQERLASTIKGSAKDNKTDENNSYHDGIAGVLYLAELVSKREISFESAQIILDDMKLEDSDFECVVLFSLQDEIFSRNRVAFNGVAFTTLRLCASIVMDNGIAAWFYRLLGKFANSSGNHELGLSYYLEGEQRLAKVVGWNTERAFLLNEATSILLLSNRNQQALEMAKTAKRLADNDERSLNSIPTNPHNIISNKMSNRTQIISNIMGNTGVALMHLDRLDEAVVIFESLTKLQESIGDEYGLNNTRFNLSTCYALLKGDDKIKFDEDGFEDEEDPDRIIVQAQYLGMNGKYEESIKLFRRFFELLSSKGQNSSQIMRESDARLAFAYTLNSSSYISEAIEQAKLAASLFESVKDSIGLHNTYKLLSQLSIYDHSISEYYAQRTLQLGKVLGNNESLIIDYGLVGQIKLSVGKYNEAIEAFQQAIKINTNSSYSIHLQDNMKTVLLEGLAKSLVGDRRIQEAISIYDELIAAAESAGNNLERARGISGLGSAYFALDEYTKAIPLLRESFSIVSVLDKNESDLIVSTANDLALVLLRTAQLEEAARVLEDTIEQIRKWDLGNKELPLLELILLSTLGDVLKEMGDWDGAKSTLLRVREINRDLGMSGEESRSLVGLGNVISLQGLQDQALEYYLEAADLAHIANKRDIEAASLDSIGFMYSQMGKPERAIEYHIHASQLHHSLEMPDDELSDLLNLTQAYVMLREIEKAKSSIGRAHEISETNAISSWELEFVEGQLTLIEESQWEDALYYFRRSISGLESIRQSLKTPMQQRQWATKKAKTYLFAAEAAILASDGGSAIEFIESNKTRFLQAIYKRRSQRPSGVSEDIWLRYEQAVDRRAELHAVRRSSLALKKPELDTLIKEAELEFSQAQSNIEFANAGENVTKTVQFMFPSWENLTKSIPDDHVAIYITYGRGLGIICVGSDKRTRKPWTKVRMYENIELDLSRLILEFSNVLGTVNTVQDSIEKWQENISYVCTELGKMLWPSIIKTIPTNTKKIILLPSGGLNILPLHAAILADGSRVNEKYIITYAPSLGIMSQIKGNRTRSKKSSSIGQVINPTNDQKLPFSRLEAYEIAKNFAEAKTIVGDDATVEHVLTLLKDTNIFHFTGHAYYDVKEPFGSGLMCAGGKMKQDGVLSLASILKRISSIKSKFVILSACETGRVQPDDILDDYLGLPGGFVIAGANTVIATLWPVDDLATCILLEKFFELWCEGRRGISAASALQAAQHWLRDKVTVEYVTDRLSNWLEEDSVLNTSMVAVMHGQWISRNDRTSFPFKDEVYWAAFYLTGLPEIYNIISSS